MSADSERGGQRTPARDGDAVAESELASARPRVIHNLELHEVTICSCPPGTPGHYPITSVFIADGEPIDIGGSMTTDAQGTGDSDD